MIGLFVFLRLSIITAMNNKKIVVFWDNKDFWETNNNEYIVCSSHSEFNDLDEATLKDAGGFLVLCELPWDHESAEIPRTEFGGIRLVQRFIRNKMNLKAPVVFATFGDAKTICDKHSEYRIIKTPALKHLFYMLPKSPQELVGYFKGLDFMTNTELAYTKLIYCDVKGLLIQINHILEGRDKSEQDNYRKDLEYVLKEQFNNDEELMEEYHNAEDLSDFCKILLARMETSCNSNADGFLYEKGHKTIKILLIEDEAKEDRNVKRFVDYIHEIEKKAEKQKAIEIKDFEKEAEALKEEEKALRAEENELEKNAKTLVSVAKQLAKDTLKYDVLDRIKDKEEALQKKTEVLGEIKNELENKKELKKRETGEKAIVSEIKTVKKTAGALEKIADAMIAVSNIIVDPKLMEKTTAFVGKATAFKGKATVLKEKAKALEKRPFTKPLFTITVEKNTDNIEYDSKHNKQETTLDYGLFEFDVIISDIEIWNEDGELVTLGFNVIETMAKESKRPLYYIVTNVSRSFYDQIKIPYIRRIRLKKEVFGTKESIKTFLYGIKEVYDHREAEAKEKVNKSEVLFNKLSDYIKKDSEKYNAIEEEVKVESMKLIKYFLSLFSTNKFKYGDGDSNNFVVFNDNCKAMREHIRETIGLGNGNLDIIVAKLEKNNQDPTDEVIANFVVRLILRRFFLYVRCFIDNYKLMAAFDAYKENKGLVRANGKRVFSKNDIACRAIGDQHKTLNNEYENEKARTQSHCLDETLLYAIRKPKKKDKKPQDVQEETLHLTDEEKDFVKALDGKSYPMAKPRISQLKIDY